ncbi:hypothetical protein C8Q77DRAFT_798742 [Trametes polyzona]|nr:hypothetical protein C8Q77DRAFT_798742 [Trametes polyzona]
MWPVPCLTERASSWCVHAVRRLAARAYAAVRMRMPVKRPVPRTHPTGPHEPTALDRGAYDHPLNIHVRGRVHTVHRTDFVLWAREPICHGARPLGPSASTYVASASAHGIDIWTCSTYSYCGACVSCWVAFDVLGRAVEWDLWGDGEARSREPGPEPRRRACTCALTVCSGCSWLEGERRWGRRLQARRRRREERIVHLHCCERIESDRDAVTMRVCARTCDVRRASVRAGEENSKPPVKGSPKQGSPRRRSQVPRSPAQLASSEP